MTGVNTMNTMIILNVMMMDIIHNLNTMIPASAAFNATLPVTVCQGTT